ncbi:hypothetical protein [Streptosporangium roseum]|uniref:hypothetical protein n=1 Tax=Streptosporangium roseum TaxID=2001 RepID=UPI0033275806
MTLSYCCPAAEFEGEGAEHSPTCPERRAAELAAEGALFDLPAQPSTGGAHP